MRESRARSQREPASSVEEEERFRAVFRGLHAGHRSCEGDEWLMRPCLLSDGTPAPRPVVWSRRNGPWRRVEILWVGAAPGNAGGRGRGELGAHGTRIPFGGDIGGANMDVLLGAAGTHRNETFITAALNQLPRRGGGEPTPAELRAPAGAHASSVHALRDTVVAAGPRLIVALGWVGLRALLAAGRLGKAEPRLPGAGRVEAAGLRRGHAVAWPPAFAPAPALLDRWREAWHGDPLPHLLLLHHPSAQNMSPYAGRETAFHRRMVEAVQAFRDTVRRVLGREPPAERAPRPSDGIYALPEWRERVGPRHAELDRLWREKGV